VEVMEGLGGFAAGVAAGGDHAVRGGELGHQEAAAALVADEAAEDGIGDAGHGRQDGGGLDANVGHVVAGGEEGHQKYCNLACT